MQQKKRGSNGAETMLAKPFIPARLAEGAVWTVVLYAYCPEKGKLRRYRVKLNHIKNIAQRRRYAAALVAKLNADLFAGWNPFTPETITSKHTVFTALDYFERKQIPTYRHDTQRTYRSQIKMLRAWLTNQEQGERKLSDYTRAMATRYIDFVAKQNVSATTVNNYVRVLKAIFGYFVEKEWMLINPFRNIRKLSEAKKKRKPITMADLARIQAYFAERRPGMLRAIYFLLYTELRPSEQCQLRIQHIDFHRSIIRVPADITKNKKDRYPTIPDHMMEVLRVPEILNAPPQWYVCGSRFMPSPVKLGHRRIATEWDRMRRALNMPAHYQFYSLRDTGILHMLQAGLTPYEVMKQSGHSDLRITSGYADHVNPTANAAIKRLDQIAAARESEKREE